MQGKAFSFRIGVGILILVLFCGIGIFAEYLAPYSSWDTDLSRRLLAPTGEYLLGCDSHGADLLSSLILGTQTSLYIGFMTIALSFSIGILCGIVAGYQGGVVDFLLMRVVDILMAFPGILLAMALAAVLGPSLHNVAFAIAATGWTSTARLVRGQVLTIKEREYITASRALGAHVARTMFYHILPGIISPLLVAATFSLSGVIIVEASLSFLGLGAQDGHPSWGTLLSQGKDFLLEAPHLSLFPGLVIFVTVIALNFLGDGLRDYLDPKDVP